MTLFVAGLPHDMDDRELLDIFSDYGTVGSAKIILDHQTQKSRGFGFVKFSDDSHAGAAIKALNGASLEGKVMTVKQAEERPSKGRVGNGAQGGYHKRNNSPAR